MEVSKAVEVKGETVSTKIRQVLPTPNIIFYFQKYPLF